MERNAGNFLTGCKQLASQEALDFGFHKMSGDLLSSWGNVKGVVHCQLN